MLGTPDIQCVENFPGNVKAQPFLEKIIRDRKMTRVADLGGGANPMLSSAFVQNQKLDYAVIDIDQRELDKAPGTYEKYASIFQHPAMCFWQALRDARLTWFFRTCLLNIWRTPDRRI
jgi:hypothetical protein